MRRPIGKRIEQVCAACEKESTFSEIAFVMGLADSTGSVVHHIRKAVTFEFVEKTGEKYTLRYKAHPNWKERIKSHNMKPQTKEAKDWSPSKRLNIGRVNSIFQLGAMV